MRYQEIIATILVFIAGFAIAFNILGPMQGWCGAGMGALLPSCVSIAGNFLAALLAMVLYISQSRSRPPLSNVEKRGRMPELMANFAMAAMCWLGFMITSLALQTYVFPAACIRLDIRIWHAAWVGAGTSAILLTSYLFVFLLYAASQPSK